MTYRSLVLAVLAISVEGCAGCTGDPSQAGFFCGVKNIAAGTYEERQTALTTEAEGTEAAARQRSDQLRALQGEEASLAAEKKALQKKLVSVQADLNKQKHLLANARLQQQADQGTLMELEARRRALEEKRMWLGQSGDASIQEVENLKRDSLRLQGQIAEVLKFTTVE